MAAYKYDSIAFLESLLIFSCPLILKILRISTFLRFTSLFKEVTIWEFKKSSFFRLLYDLSKALFSCSSCRCFFWKLLITERAEEHNQLIIMAGTKFSEI